MNPTKNHWNHFRLIVVCLPSSDQYLSYIHEEKKANKQKVVNLAILEYWPDGKLLVEKDMHIINYWQDLTICPATQDHQRPFLTNCCSLEEATRCLLHVSRLAFSLEGGTICLLHVRSLSFSLEGGTSCLLHIRSLPFSLEGATSCLLHVRSLPFSLEGGTSCLLHVSSLTFSRGCCIHLPVFDLTYMTNIPLFSRGILLQ